MYCSMFTTKYLISILHYTVDPGYTFCLPPHPSPQAAIPDLRVRTSFLPPLQCGGPGGARSVDPSPRSRTPGARPPRPFWVGLSPAPCGASRPGFYLAQHGSYGYLSNGQEQRA